MIIKKLINDNIYYHYACVQNAYNTLYDNNYILLLHSRYYSFLVDGDPTFLVHCRRALLYRDSTPFALQELRF